MAERAISAFDSVREAADEPPDTEVVEVDVHD